MGLLSFLMFAVNITFWVMGGAMLGVGIWLAVDPNAGDILGIAGAAGMDDSLYWAAVYMMIGIGAGVFLVGFLGCVGALRAGKGGNIFLKLYFILVKLIIISEFISIILIAVFWGSLNDSVRQSMYDDLVKDYVSETSNDFYSNSWNKMQVDWKCCGSFNYTDYRQSAYTRNTTNSVPWTCCLMKTGTNGEDIGDVANIGLCRIEGNFPYTDTPVYTNLYPKGCYDALFTFLDDNSAIIIGVTCGFIGLQILGSIMACILMKKGGGD
jgi:hypothetical protein